MKKQLLCTLAVAAMGFTACKKHHNDSESFTYPDMAEATDPAVLYTTAQGVKVYNGGFGSAMAADPNEPDVFYLMTDRGPNVAGTANNSIIIGRPDFCPEIGKYRLKDGKLVLEQVIEFKNAAGIKLNGLPNPAGMGASGETTYDLNDQVIAPSADGIDSEGMVRLADGTFWVSDEYGPHIVHFDAPVKPLSVLTLLAAVPAAVKFRLYLLPVVQTAVWKA
ncbi:esterase-like activity of phytase family protein [Mucilaginibacter sp. CSA2-8R]|uniref:esterase-like activity of phytase family protein n=1 Tax=Mucilaginibacter sp. CSA2-8R TaxID=3141542 RepID=UPI00315D36BD